MLFKCKTVYNPAILWKQEYKPYNKLKFTMYKAVNNEKPHEWALINWVKWAYGRERSDGWKASRNAEKPEIEGKFWVAPNVYNLMSFHDVTDLFHEVCFTHEGEANSAMLHIKIFFEEPYWAIKKPSF